MKKFIISLIVLTMVTTAAFADTTAFDNKGKITATANEFAYISPDTVSLTFTVETMDKNSQKAEELNNEKSKAIIEVIKKSLTEKESIKTANYNMRQNYEYNSLTKKDVLTGYRVTNTLMVTLKDTKKTGKIIDMAIKNGATNVSNLSFTLQNTSNICKELTSKAALKAKAEANNILAPLGKTVDSIYNIDYSCSTRTSFPQYRNYTMMKSMATADSASGGVSVEEGESRVDASVTIVFTIK